jgi:hypothetical protein
MMRENHFLRLLRFQELSSFCSLGSTVKDSKLSFDPSINLLLLFMLPNELCASVSGRCRLPTTALGSEGGFLWILESESQLWGR